MSRNLALVSALALAALAVVLVGGVVLGGCAAGDGGGDLAGIPLPPSSAATTPMVSAATPGSSVDGGSPRTNPNPPDAATGVVDSSPGPAPSYQGPNPPPDPPPTPSAATPLPSDPTPTPDASLSAPPMPPAGPVVIICVVPGASVRYDCEGLPGDNDQGIDFSSNGSTLGADTQCGAGHPATVRCPSGAFCRVYTSAGTLEGTCL